jgi:hypothetical protein
MSRSFTQARKKLERQTKADVACTSLNDIALAVRTGDIDDAKVSYRVLHIEVDPTEFESIGLRWASPFVEEQFLSRMLEMNLNTLWMTYRRTPGSMKDIFYEPWAQRILAERGQTPVCMRSLTQCGATGPPIPYVRFTNKHPPLTHLRSWGCVAYVLRPIEDARSSTPRRPRATWLDTPTSARPDASTFLRRATLSRPRTYASTRADSAPQRHQSITQLRPRSAYITP